MLQYRKLSFSVLLFYFVLSSIASQSQDCLQLLETAKQYASSDKSKTLLTAGDLLLALDSAKCPTELGYAETYNNVGIALLEAGAWQMAEYALHKSLSLNLKDNDSTHFKLEGVCFNLALLYQKLGDYKEAHMYMLWGVRVVQANYTGIDPLYLNAQYKSAVFHREMGEFEQSKKDFQETLAIAEKYFPENDSIQGSILTEFGALMRLTGHYEDGEAALRRAIDLLKGRHELLHLKAVDRLAALKLDMGEFSESENVLLGNMQLKSTTYPKDSALMVETLSNLAVLYYRINDLETAVKYLEQLKQHSKGMGEVMPYYLNNLGVVFLRKGDLKQAEHYFDQSTQAFRGVFGGIHPDYASALSNLANVRKNQGDLTGAMNLYMRVLDLDKVIYGVNAPRYATSLNNMALIYQAIGYNKLAYKFLKQSLEIRKNKLGVKNPLYAKTLNDLGVYYLLAGDTVGAMESFDEALMSELHHMQTVLPVLTDEQRQLFFEDIRFNLERFASLAFAGKQFDTQWSEKAFNYYINTKSILFYASDKMRRTMLESEDASLRNTFLQWRELKYKLAQSYLLPEEELIERNLSLDDMENQCDQLEKKLAVLSSSFSGQESLHFHAWEDIPPHLGDGTALLELIEYHPFKINRTSSEKGAAGWEQGFEKTSAYVAFILSKNDKLRKVRVGGKTLANEEFNYYSNALKHGIKDERSYGNYWKAIDDHLQGAGTVYYAPDGVYHKINPAVMYDALAGKYVSDKYKIINVTSGKDFLQQSKSSPSTAKGRAVIFGNPNFSLLAIEETLPLLPEAEREADDVTEILNKKNWEVSDFYYLNATETNLKKYSNPDVLHLATHGYFKEGGAHKSVLLNSGVYLARNPETEDDGILTAYEAMNLQLDKTKLVVLSACETALGTIKNGEGIFGLQRAFLIAGAGNVIISLVKVNDAATRHFMQLFYSELAESRSIEDSFFKARAAFRLKYSNPYIWGAFVLVTKP